MVVIGNEENYQLVKEALKDVPVKVFAGSDAIGQVAGMDSVDMVLTAMVGYSGLIPTLKAVEAGKSVAIANKETLVVAGELVTQLAREKQVGLLPVDSEHSAIFQCLAGEFMNPAEKSCLPVPGSLPGKNSSQLAKVTPTDALAHPNWEMGAKITIDSATLMNKGFEMIEAHWLFGLPEEYRSDRPPQSIIHSMVQFRDGSMKAQLGLPDMRLPILYALGFPERIANDFPRLDFRKYPNLTFEEPDIRNFPNLALAYEAIAKGGNIPCVLNAANEIVVNAFLEGKIGFTTMPLIIEKAILKAHFIPSPSLDDLIYTNNETRSFSESLILSEKINQQILE